MKKSLSFPFSFIFTFCFFLPDVSNLKAMEPSLQISQDVPSLPTDENSSVPDSKEFGQLFETLGIPVTPNTLRALAEYSSPLEREKLVGVLSKNPRHADSLSQLIVEGTLDPHTVTPEDVNTATSLLDAGFSVPSNFREVREKLSTSFPTEDVTPEDISIVSGIFDPSVKDTENSVSKNLRHAYETENRLLRTLMSKGLSLKERQILRRRGSVVKDLPMGKAPSSFFEELFELKTDPLTALKRVDKIRKSILEKEAALDMMDPKSSEAQRLQKAVMSQKSYLSQFPKDIVDRYVSLMQQRRVLSFDPTPSSYQKMNEIDQQLLDLAFEKSLRTVYSENILNPSPPKSKERLDLKNLLLETPSLEEFTGAQWAHAQGIKGKKASILILEGLHSLPTPERDFGIDTPLPSDLSHALAVEDVARRVAPHADIFVKQIKHHQFFSYYPPPHIIQDALNYYELGSDFGSPSKIINLSQSLPDSQIFQILQTSGNHLFVLAAGNDGQRMEEQGLFYRYDASTLDPLKNNIIFSGSLTRNFNKASHSNFPDFFQREGEDPHYFQDRFLFTLGSHVPVRNSYPTYKAESGTSFAAPMISGAAALLQGAYPSFSMQDIQTILLESAEKNFMMQTSLPQAPEAYTYVYDPFDPQNKDLKASRNVTLEHFDPAVFGKGVLSIRRALIYAQIYNRLKIVNPTLPPEELKELTHEEFQEFMLIEHKAKGKTLLRALKRFLAQQRAARGAPSHNPPLQTKAPKKGPPKPKPHSVPPPHAEPPKEPLPAKPTPPHSASVRDRIKHFNHMSKDF